MRRTEISQHAPRYNSRLSFPPTEPPSFTKFYYNGSYKISELTNEIDELDVEIIQISEDYVDYESLIVTLAEDGTIFFMESNN